MLRRRTAPGAIAMAVTEASGPITFRQMGAHQMMTDARHDEIAREDFVQSLHFQVLNRMRSGNEQAFEKNVLPGFVRANNRPPKNRQEVRKEMAHEPYHQMWSSLRRTSQELMWDAAAASSTRDAPRLSRRARTNGRAKGTLTLNPAVKTPRYVSALDIHCMPGNYHTEMGDDDVYVASIYDRGVYSLTQGFFGPYIDSAGHTVVSYLRREHPAFAPRRILDIGCAIGHSTLPFCDAFPTAELHAIDVAAPMLRYAHARAESLGKAVHFSQQNGEFMDFADNSFDLAVTMIFMHELSTKAIRNIVREMHRVLRPGGMMINLEQPQYEGKTPIDTYMRDWDTLNNNEPFWGTLHDMDLQKLAVDGGFASKAVTQTMQPNVVGGELMEAADRMSRDYSGRGMWFFFQAVK